MPNGAPTVDGLSIETAEADEPADEEEEDTTDETTFERMTGVADPEQFDRTFLAKKENWRLAGPFASPAPFPLQVLPRMAYTINYNYALNEEQNQWEPQKKSDIGAQAVGKGFQANSTSFTVADGAESSIDVDGVTTERGVTVDEANDQLTIDEAGFYVVGGSAQVSTSVDGANINFRVEVNGTSVAQDERAPSVPSGSSTIQYQSSSPTDELSEGDNIQVIVDNDSGSSLTVEGGEGATHVYATLVAL